jgi:nucleotide-binding universal stress UspA family protein
MYRHIMVPLDGSKLAECVIPHAQAIAKGCSIVTVTFIRVVEPLHLRGGAESRLSAGVRKMLEEDNMKVAKEYLDQWRQQFQSEGIDAQSEVPLGNVVDTLVDFGKKKEVDLLILATHGRSGISRWAWGSIADRLLRSACMPVMMVRAPGCVPGI